MINIVKEGKHGVRKKFFSMILVGIALIPILFWISSLIKCEVLTYKYYSDFERAYTNNTMLGEMEYFKVLSCDGMTAEVYYVSQDKTDANVLTFTNESGTWIETSWNTIWSSSGSASDVIYPYWWHFIYGGF